ncbi:hypothetical protein [Aliiglaciecola lipolytica]|uniref:Uncharacterized protein n=1 Tax=Aliiglaciecola lipolytica E3 TaxID=1127673 RepID=K6WX37_9ALTE|nr:hypothetical protein [Aliiglaciecola lipolytica]GAC13014.1 hypothetical protein GLIP_0367 [Aliiglaciecola lipolytica E3]
MIVTSADYSHWQVRYGHGNTTKTSEKSEEQRQSFALSSGNDLQSDKQKTLSADSTSTNELAKTNAEEFYQNSYAQLLANRLGIDKQKIDELEAELEAKQQEYEALSKQVPRSAENQKNIDFLANKIEQLKIALENYIEQSSKRGVEQEMTNNATKRNLSQFENITSILTL